MAQAPYRRKAAYTLAQNFLKIGKFGSLLYNGTHSHDLIGFKSHYLEILFKLGPSF